MKKLVYLVSFNPQGSAFRNNFLEMKKVFYTVSVLVFVVMAITMVGCMREEEPDGLMKSKYEYEAMLKKEVNGLLSQKGLLEENFLMMHGLPMWESMRWVNIESKNMIVVPLLNSTDNKKFIVSVITKENISSVITELSAANSSENRIFSLNNKLLHDNSGLNNSIPRLKNNSEASSAALEYLIYCGGNAQLLYTAANGNSSGYNGNASAGTVCIMADATGSGSSFNTSGHAWLKFSDNYGNTMTFGTWGFNPYTGSANSGYYVNAELNRPGSSYCIAASYNQLQSLLNYNSQAGNTGWGYTYNCAGYASGAWNAVTGQSIGGGLTTPSHINDWINNH